VRVAELVTLPFDGFADGGMSVAQAAHSRTPRGIQISLTACLVKEQSFASHGHGRGYRVTATEDQLARL
jgi:hypothetical protein